jgi:hypothetical protein
LLECIEISYQKYILRLHVELSPRDVATHVVDSRYKDNFFYNSTKLVHSYINAIVDTHSRTQTIMFRENFNQEIRESVGARRRRNSGRGEGKK